MIVEDQGGREGVAHVLRDGLGGGEPPVGLGEELDDERVALAELVLQVLESAQAAEPTVHHDGEARAQSLALLHTGE